MSNHNTLNREGWLHAFAEKVAPMIKSRTGHSVPLSRVRLSCSFPKGRATPSRKGTFTTGQCWHGDTHSSGLHEIMINPLRDNSYDVAETVIHELLHASLPKGTGHKAPFARAAKNMGLEGKPTSTILSDALKKDLGPIIAEIGNYPHKALTGEWGKKQTTRLLKVQCLDCGYVNEQGNGYTARITMTWIENAGLPTCPCGATMSLIDANGPVEMIALKPVESSATYQVPNADGTGHDPRFQIRRASSERLGDRWSVIDFGDEMLMESTARIVAAEGKQDALDMISAVREGLYTWSDLEDNQEDLWDEEDDDENPLAEPDEDFEKLIYLGEDEEEDPDHPEDQTPEKHIERKRFQGEWVEREISFDYDEVRASREK